MCYCLLHLQKSKKLFLLRRSKLFVIELLVIVVLMAGCATSHKARKLPKRGPIPCPVKDC